MSGDTGDAGRRRLLLAIEASNPSLGTSAVAVAALGDEVAGARVIDREPIAASTRERDDLVPAIDRVFIRSELDRRDTVLVAVSAGPGGYTAIRMAIAAGAMIADGISGEGRRAQCIAVPTAMVAAAAFSDARVFPLAVALAHKGDAAFVTAFDSPLIAPTTAAGHVLGPEGFAALAPQGVRTLVADPGLPVSLRAAAQAAGLTIEPLRLTVEALVRAARLVARVEPAGLVPIYAREPEAVTLWRARHGTG